MENAAVNIRRAVVWDARAIVDLWAKQMIEAPIFMCSANENELKRFYIHIIYRIERDVVFVAEIDKKVIGYISGNMMVRPFGSSHPIGFCENLYIEKEYRSLKLLNDLCNSVIEETVKLGAKELQFIIPYELEIYRKLRERQGYKPALVYYCKEVI